MKTLSIIRHGKATQEPMPDIKRHLTPKGIDRTSKRAKDILQIDVKPDLIISSPAVRAFQTAEILAKELNYPKEIGINPVFYFHSLPDVMSQIKQIPDTFENVVIVGHNPVWTNLADYFLPEQLFHLRTSGLAVVNFDTLKWSGIHPDKVKSYHLFN